MEKNKSSHEKYRAYSQYKTLIPINEERKQLQKVTDQSGTLKKTILKWLKKKSAKTR